MTSAYHYSDWPVNPAPVVFDHQADIVNIGRVWAITRNGSLVRLYLSEADARRNVARINLLFKNATPAIVSVWPVFPEGHN